MKALVMRLSGITQIIDGPFEKGFPESWSLTIGDQTLHCVYSNYIERNDTLMPIYEELTVEEFWNWREGRQLITTLREWRSE